jgi:hypothetical protein
MDMLLPVQASGSMTYCCLFEHVAAEHVAAWSSMLLPDLNMLHVVARKEYLEPLSADNSMCS